MIRLTIPLVFCLSAAYLFAQDGLPDPVFSSIPFDQWLQPANQARIRWTLRVSDPELSPHQRLAVRLDVQVDGAELAKRAGAGRFFVLVQLLDEKNRAWRNHQQFDLDQIADGIKVNDAVFNQSFFVLPGTYRLAVAVFDDATGEHSVIQRNLRVAALKNDPLPDMWLDLPPVEFFAPDSSVDRWYLPSVEGRLHLPVETRRITEVDLLVNLTPAERLAGSTRVQDRNLEALIPAIKVLSQVQWRNASFNVEWLDLSRRRVAYRQDNVVTLDWAKASGALSRVNPGIIDVRSLANRRFSADFFLNRVARKIGLPGQDSRPPRVLIVLSANVFFEPGMDIHPIHIPSRPDVTVIYIRYQPRPQVLLSPEGRPHRAFAPGLGDQLEALLKPLAPHLFDVATPEQFRRSLAGILELTAKL